MVQSVPPVLLPLGMLLALPFAADVNAASLQIEFETEALPTQITLCRSPVSAGMSEHVWAALIDADRREDTGEGGIDVLVRIATPPPAPGCVPTLVPLASNLLLETSRWDAGLGAWAPDDDVAGVLQVDTAQRRLGVSFGDAAVTALALDDRSRVYAAAQAIYPDGNGFPAAAVDFVEGALQLAGAPVRLDPALDLQDCNEACDPFYSWYHLADVRAVRLQGQLPVVPAFSTDTLRLGFVLEGLPAQVELCRDGLPDLAGFADFNWSIAVDVDGRRDTGEDLGEESGGIDVFVAISSPPRTADCSARTLPAQEAFVAAAYAWDALQSTYVPTDIDAVLRVDPDDASLRIDLDRAHPRLQALSTSTRFTPSSSAIRVTLPLTDPPEAELVMDWTQPAGLVFDTAPILEFFDPGGDVNCASCDPFGVIARMADFSRFQAEVLGPVVFDPELFGNGFEPP